MKPIDPAKLATVLGFPLDARMLAAVAVLIPIIGVVGVLVYKRWKTRGAAKTEATPPSPALGGGVSSGAPAAAPKLYEAWTAFTKSLPSQYRRSILNFEHYVVLGDAAHGKSCLVDLYTDWQRQEKQFLASTATNPELPVYITSRAVVMEIPAKVLNGVDVGCKDALTKLWKPLYKQKSPIIVVTVHAQKLIEMAVDEIQGLGETIRGKINLLASIRGRSLEVRVVLTHLDKMEGYGDVAAFCRGIGVPSRVGLRSGANVETALGGWLDAMKGQLPHALLTVNTSAYGRILRFLNGASRLIKPIGHLYASLFAHVALSPDPVRGDLYFASQPAGHPNPLAQGDRSPGPDPRQPHLIGASLVAGASMAFLGLAFSQQYAEWSTAHELLKNYVPNAVNPASELRDRHQIVEFTNEHSSFLDTHPDFFATPRINLRKEFSNKIRTEYLIPAVREVARTGAPEMGEPVRTHQRCLYFIGLIHSDKKDVLSIQSKSDAQGRDRLSLWSTMTGIDPDFITDYLNNTDEVDLNSFAQLDPQDVDPHDTKKPWQSFLDDVRTSMADDVVSVEELDRLQRTAKELEPHVVRLKDADVTLDILKGLDEQRVPHSASNGEDDSDGLEAGGPSNGLAQKYNAFFGKFLTEHEAFRHTTVSELSGMLETVRETGLVVDEERGLLPAFIGRLNALYRQRLPVTDNGRLIEIDWVANCFDELAWYASIREAKAHMLVESFVTNSTERDIFFAPGEVIPDTTWNPTGSAAAVFVGRYRVDGRYTREMYDTRVRRPVLALSDLLDNVKVVETDRALLTEFVRTGVRRYATNFRTGFVTFIGGFQLNVSSPEGLRVALTQMSAESGGTSFDEFLKTVDKNTRLNAQSPKTSFLEPMLAPAFEQMKTFEAWHGVVDPEKGAPRIIEYKKILQQLLISLGGSLESVSTDVKDTKQDEKASADVTEAVAKETTLETDLTLTGRVYLDSVLNNKGAYSGLVRAWIGGTNLPSEQQLPFLLPFQTIDTSGRNDVKTVIDRALQRELMGDLERMMNRFPFDKSSREDVTPDELTKFFHPKDGRVYSYFRRYLEPISLVEGEGGYRVNPSIRGVRPSKSIYDFLNAAVLLSSRLWDETGKPRTLDYSVVTVPFDKEGDESDPLTLVYLNVGEGSLFNFNQKNTTKKLSLDWTKTASSQIGVQLTNTETKENSFPAPIVRNNSYFSFLRLLMAADQPPGAVKEPPTAQLYTWRLTLSNNKRVTAQVVLRTDPWDTFTLRAAVTKMVNRHE